MNPLVLEQFSFRTNQSISYKAEKNNNQLTWDSKLRSFKSGEHINEKRDGPYAGPAT